MRSRWWKRPLCWITGHEWSSWYPVKKLPGARTRKKRQCYRCGAPDTTVEKINVRDVKLPSVHDL